VALLANKRSANRPNLQGPRRFTTKDDKKKNEIQLKNEEALIFKNSVSIPFNSRNYKDSWLVQLDMGYKFI